MSRLISRKPEAPLDLAGLRLLVEEWYGIKRQSNFLSKKLNEGKDTLKRLVERHGTTDPSNGSIFLELEEPVGDRKILKLKNQRSTTTGLNEEAAERILKGKGLWDEMVEMVPVLDTSKVHAAYYDNKITDEELGQIFPKTVTYSFILLDDVDKPVS